MDKLMSTHTMTMKCDEHSLFSYCISLSSHFELFPSLFGSLRGKTAHTHTKLVVSCCLWQTSRACVECRAPPHTQSSLSTHLFMPRFYFRQHLFKVSLFFNFLFVRFLFGIDRSLTLSVVIIVKANTPTHTHKVLVSTPCV